MTDIDVHGFMNDIQFETCQHISGGSVTENQVREETAVELIVKDHLINAEAREAPISILASFSGFGYRPDVMTIPVPFVDSIATK